MPAFVRPTGTLETRSRWKTSLGGSRPARQTCPTDRRSAKALLARRGFGEVQVIQGGMTAWLANGWPVESTPIPNP